MKTKKFIYTVGETGVDQRLDRYLASLPGIASRSYAADLIEKKLVTVNGSLAKSSLILKLEQTVEILLPEKAAPTALVPYNFKLDIIFEDDDLLVINKPSGLVVHPSVGHEGETLVNALLFHTSQLSMKNEMRPGIVHRIDKETSGLLVIAKNDFAHENLSQQFKQKTTHRIYYALVDGAVQSSSGTIQTYLARHPIDRKRYASVRLNNKIVMTYDSELSIGKWAVTHYQKLAQSSAITYMKIRLETGRTHQIRVHLSELGHRLIGDTTYGYPKQKMQHFELNRFFLHAAELGFEHPRSKKYLEFKVNWPAEDLKKILSLGFKNEVLRK